MSEFKYACPVCGQHIKCDSSRAGTVMDCPTCFQKITVPQAPASDDQKLILSGSQVTERKNPAPAAAGGGTAPEKKFPAAAVLVGLLLAGAAGAAVLVFHGKIFNLSGADTPANRAAIPGGKPPKKPAAVAPPANDTNWLMTLGTNAIPNSPVAGRIHARDFIVERASFQNGLLTLRQGTRGPVEFGVQVNFSGTPPETLAGKNLNILADTNKSARVTLHWKDDAGAAQKSSYEINYAMRLEFGKLANNRLPGKIYLCTPDAEKSYLLGAFNALVSKPKPKPPQPPK